MGVNIRVYKGLVPGLERINKKWNDAGGERFYKVRRIGETGKLKGEVVTAGYNCRNVKGTDKWSMHAFGLAIDINADTNPWQEKRETDIPTKMVNWFIEEGWGWGGWWTKTKDTMHFTKWPESTGKGGGDQRVECSQVVDKKCI